MFPTTSITLIKPNFKQAFFLSLVIISLTTNITTRETNQKATLTIDKVDLTTNINFATPPSKPQVQSQHRFQEPFQDQYIPPQYPQQQHQPVLSQIVPYPVTPESNPTQTGTQVVYLPIPPKPAGASPFLHPLAVILILCSILGFISVLITLPFNLPGSGVEMSSSSSSAKPSSSSSSSKPSSSSSSSSSRPSSSSSGGSGSSSSSSSSQPKPASPQPVPQITANAWMSFFLFCCLVLIILQGPLGLTGNSVLPTLPSFGGIGGGWSGMPGCVGVATNYVPWCQQQQVQSQPQIQVQQVVQNSNPAGGLIPGANAEYVGAGQMGGQGGFATPNGGGGWSWYANGAGAGQVVRQQPAYYNPQQQRSVQYQRPGLQIQINNARGGGAGVGGVAQQAVIPQYPHPYYHYTCPTTYQYQYLYQYGYNQYCYPTNPYGYTYNGRCTPWQPWNCNYLPNVFAYAQSIPQTHSYDGDEAIVGSNGNVNIQSQHVGSTPPAVPVQAIPVTPPPPMLPPASAIAGLANLENAFYPLLVGAIALLVVFDYAG